MADVDACARCAGANDQHARLPLRIGGSVVVCPGSALSASEVSAVAPVRVRGCWECPLEALTKAQREEDACQ